MDRTRRLFYLIVGITVLLLLASTIYLVHRNRSDNTAQTLPSPPPTISPTSKPTQTYSPTPTPTPTTSPTGTPSPIPTPTSTPGPQFVEDCNQTPSTDWLAYGNGTFITINDHCLFLPASRDELNLALIGSADWQDYAVDLDVHYTRDDKDDYCGVIVLAQDERNYIYFSMGGRGQNIAWWIRFNGDPKLVPETQQTSALKDGTKYHVRVEVLGGKIVTYLDGKEVARFGTPITSAGAAGVFAYSQGASPQRLCAFDDFRLSPLQP